MFLDVLSNHVVTESSLEVAITNALQTDAPEMLPFASLLNDVLGIAIAETAASTGLAKDAHDTTVRVLMLALFRSIAEAHNAVILIDDGLYMDPQSWDFTMDIASSGKFIMDSAPPSIEVAKYFHRHEKSLGEDCNSHTSLHQ